MNAKPRSGEILIEPWSEPDPLEMGVPAFPLDSLPTVALEATLTVAGMLATPLDLPAITILACIAAATRGRVTVGYGPDWQVPTNLYVIPIAAPGEHKSPVVDLLAVPLLHAEKRLALESESERRRQAVEHAAALASVERASKAVKVDPTDPDALRALEDATAALDKTAEPVTPRLVVGHDTTPEALPVVMAQQGGALSIITDEGAELFNMMGRYQSKAANTGVYLKGFDGARYTCDRKGSPPIVIERALLTIFAAIQPGTLDTIKGDKNREQGLLARFAYVYPRSEVGTRATENPPLDRAAMERYANMLNRIIDCGERELHLSDEASQRFGKWRAEHERRLGPHGDLSAIVDWANKLPGLVLRLAGILHLASDTRGDVIGKTILVDALDLAAYLADHARRAFDQMELTDDMKNARKLLDAIRRNVDRTQPVGTCEVLVVSERDAYRWAKLSAADATQAFKVLAAYGWTQEVETERPTTGRPPSTVHALNPATFG